MKYLLPGLLVLIFSCHGKEQEDPANSSEPFQALSFIKAQVRDVDTSLYSIQKIIHVENHSDTTPISREQFRQEAAPFLNLPDIASKSLRDDYKEENLFDQALGRVVLFYTTTQEKAAVQREQVIIDPNRGTGFVESIIIDYYESNNGNSTHRNLVWTTNKSFQISESLPGPGGTERIRHTEVIWNDFPSESH